MTYISDFFSLFGTVYKLLLEFPLLGIGILAGVFGYRYLLLKDPTLLAKLVAKAEAAVKDIEQDVTSATTSTGTGSGTPTQS
jgi:hypothetical protein